MEETAIRFLYEQRKVFRLRSCALRKKHGVPGFRRVYCVKKHGVAGFRRASPGYKKKSFTYVSLICDHADVQPLLPQMGLSNEITVKEHEIESLRLAGANCFHS